MQPLNIVRMELCKDARCVESCFGDEFVRRVGAEGEERGETIVSNTVYVLVAHSYCKLL
jgi:hypothetical protein